MNTIIAGFIGPQEIIIILLLILGMFSIVFFVVLFLLARVIKNSGRNKGNGQQGEYK